LAYVYVLSEIPHPEERSGPWTKIGYSKNPPEWRLNANLKRGNSRDIVVAGSFEYSTEREARDAERAAHERFGDHAGPNRKEWFRLSATEAERFLLSTGGTKVDTSKL
jgi:hypothetical protein